MALLHKTLVRSAAEFAAVRPLWEELSQVAGRAVTIFGTFSWNLLAAQVFADKLLPMLASVEGDAGAAIIPACLNLGAQQIELLGEALFDYRDVLHSGSQEALRAAWQMLTGFGMPVVVRAVQPEAMRTRWASFRSNEFARAPWVDASRITEQEFRAAHPRVGSRLRKMQRHGITLHEYPGSAREITSRLYQLKCDQFAADGGNVFRDRSRREFMVEIAAEEASQCKVFTLEDDAACIVAGLVTFLDGPMRRFYTVYFDPQWAKYSPGVALVYEATARSLAEGLSCDYMTGEYPYKLRFANATRMLYEVQASAEELAEIAQPERTRRIA